MSSLANDSTTQSASDAPEGDKNVLLIELKVMPPLKDTESKEQSTEFNHRHQQCRLYVKSLKEHEQECKLVVKLYPILVHINAPPGKVIMILPHEQDRNLMARDMPFPPLVERYFMKVEKGDDCSSEFRCQKCFQDHESQRHLGQHKCPAVKRGDKEWFVGDEDRVVVHRKDRVVYVKNVFANEDDEEHAMDILFHGEEYDDRMKKIVFKIYIGLMNDFFPKDAMAILQRELVVAFNMNGKQCVGTSAYLRD